MTFPRIFPGFPSGFLQDSLRMCAWEETVPLFLALTPPTPSHHAKIKHKDVIDTCGGDKVPRKGGPGVTQSDLLVVNKTDLAEAVGADLGVMERDASAMRSGGPTVFAQVKHGVGVADIAKLILEAVESIDA